MRRWEVGCALYDKFEKSAGFVMLRDQYLLEYCCLEKRAFLMLGNQSRSQKNFANEVGMIGGRKELLAVAVERTLDQKLLDTSGGSTEVVVATECARGNKIDFDFVVGSQSTLAADAVGVVAFGDGIALTLSFLVFYFASKRVAAVAVAEVGVGMPDQA